MHANTACRGFVARLFSPSTVKFFLYWFSSNSYTRRQIKVLKCETQTLIAGLPLKPVSFLPTVNINETRETWTVKAEHICGRCCCIFSLLSREIPVYKCIGFQTLVMPTPCPFNIPIIFFLCTEVAAFPGPDGRDRRTFNWSGASQIELDASTGSCHRFLVRTDGWTQGNDN